LCRCLRSLEYQTYPQSFLDSIVVNNDATAPLRYLEADFPTVTVVTEARSGRGAARKKGISCARSDVVAIFDSDVLPATDCLERAMRAMKEQPASRVFVCRVDPLFRTGKSSYIERVVEWVDAVNHYNPRDCITNAGAFVTGALIVRKEVFADCGYFSNVCPSGASEDGEWVRRVIAAGDRLTFCREAVVRRETVRRVAELRRKMQREARGDCFLETLERSAPYGVLDAVQTEWRALRRRVRNAWTNKSMPVEYRVGVLLISLWSSVWTLTATLQYTDEAQRLVRRRRREMNRAIQPSANGRTRPSRLPFHWLGSRVASRPGPKRDATRQEL
ncbi:MAG TPA: glycosyltransferase family A protein, partial [Gemmatimonadaceae bacterium]|nr:glycosyltransferase family A protein [Gemmatimonadaceae bacterium]